ncbi:ArsR/SmtB family transcription factor [Allorhizocola rhizosphaerae]|uniref:ArsR/SmtB family transcription factor n=1 Tax=Allorhizocola rhizosphaerae TaxID=1872709 RepID=UPI001B8B7B81|nr:winged helix-turn-helix domain-containing protein [Allorhizocola rhizosphaerae]
MTPLARLAGLLADPSRSEICLALLDGRAWTAGELARHAGIAPSTATEHVNALVEGGLLASERQGRHRYVRIADPATAALLEELASHAAQLFRQDPPRSLREAKRSDAMARARTCYDHFAGRLGVEITAALVRRRLLMRDSLALTRAGRGWLSGLDIDVTGLESGRRPLSRACLDWTERRPHLAGAVGAALCERAFARDWVERIGTGRAVRITPTGRTAFIELFGLAF